MTKEELDALIKKSAEDAAKTAVAAVTTTFTTELAKRDTEIKILKMSATHKSFYDGLKDEDAKKAFADMDEKGRDAECAKVAKAGDPLTVADLAKRDEVVGGLLTQNAEMKKRLDAMDLEKAQESFKKRAAGLGLTAEGDGELMRKAYSGDAVAQEAFEKRQAEVLKAKDAQIATSKLFDNFGNTQAPTGKAYDALMAKAAELRKADPTLSEAQAFTKVYTDPANAETVQLHKRETLPHAN